jgi:dynein heavy chain
VALVETFQRLAKRDAVKTAVKNRAEDVRKAFLDQIAHARNQFDNNKGNPPLRIHEPQFAGSALWAHSLAALVTESYDSLVRLKTLIPIDKAIEDYTAFIGVIKDFKQARYRQWSEDLSNKADNPPNGLQLRLDKHLLRRADSDGHSMGKSGTEIVCNFDEDLLSLFSEVAYWEKFHGEFSIPYVAHDLCNKKEQLRVMREHVMQVVRAYNDIVRDIHSDERHLFIDHLRRLDRRIGPGMTKLTWQSRNMIDMYVRDCCSNCQDVHAIVKEFKESRNVIAKVTKQIGSALLLRVDKNTVYEGKMQIALVDK